MTTPASSYFLKFDVDGRDNADEPVTVELADGYPLIELRGNSETSGCADLTVLTAAEARWIAEALTVTADRIDASAAQ